MLYHKINSIFKRDHDTNKFIDEFAKPEFEDLLDVEWRGTEKVDGTNIRIYVEEDGNFSIRGRTDKANLPPELIDHINTLNFKGLEGLELFGEGYGGKIQKGAGYGNDVKFILFDAVITESKRFLTREELSLIKLDQVFEYWPAATLAEWIEDFRAWQFPKSVLRDDLAEGVVLTPRHNYLNKYGHRIITKLKVKDFQ